MAMITRTIAINAAFLQEIKEDNRDLRMQLECAATTIADATVSRRDNKQLVDVLAALRDQLAMHFALEEAYGYFEDALEVAPRLSEMADALQSEHQTLFVEICEIAELAEQLLYQETSEASPGRISVRFRRFHRRLEQHERNENDLILQAFDDDIGTGD